ncbi:MAG: glycosyltransferase family 2 protein [Betaproteobacteria bacterium]|nr:glycosyltransferase family 2 protein [Betaproteobacteria bacterium]
MPLSAVIITHNAAASLEPCLASVAFADEVLIVDSDSSDDTVKLAERHRARVVRKKWLGFGPQKQFAIEAATHDWVLCIDADERVSELLQTSILAAIAAPESGAYTMARCNRFLGRWLKHGEGYPDRSLRLFDRRLARWSDDNVHEKVLTSQPVIRLRGDLLHDSAESLERYLEKQNRYTSLQADQLALSGGKVSAWQLVLSPLLRFIKFYFFRLGFLDGIPGLIHVSIGCMNSFNKYAKLMALQRSAP